MALKKIAYATLILGAAAGFAVAGAPKADAAGRTPIEVTVKKNFNSAIDVPAEDKFVPGPDPVEGVGEGFYFTGLGVVEGGREVVKGVGEGGGRLAEDAQAYGPPGLVSGAAKGVVRAGEGAVYGAGTVAYGALKGAGCIVTFGTTC